MTIARKLKALTLGLAVAPFILSPLAFSIVFALSRETDAIKHLFVLHRWLENELIAKLQAGDLPAEPPPEGIWVVAVDEADRVLYSTFELLPPGTSLAAYSEAERREIEAMLYDAVGMSTSEGAFRILEDGAGNQISIVHSEVPVPPAPPETLGRASSIAAGLFVAVVIVAGLSAAAFMRAFRTRMAGLQAGIHRIAGGNLNEPVTSGANDEFGQLAADLDRMRVALSQDRERRSRFLMAVSHDLGTPLTTIRGYIEAIEDGIVSDGNDLAIAARAMHDKSDMLQERIDELIEFVRLETGEWRLQFRRLVARDYLHDLSADFGRDVHLAGLRFEGAIEVPDDVTIYADPRLLRRALENLVQNAIRYGGVGGCIHFAASLLETDDTKAVTIQVRDNGPGFGDLDPDEMFEPFRRGSTARNERGFGLGLSIVRSVLDAHGFTVRARSDADRGTVFEVHAPVLSIPLRVQA